MASFCNTAKESLPGAVACAAVRSGSATVVLKKGMVSNCLLTEPGTSRTHRVEEHGRADGSVGRKEDAGQLLEGGSGAPRWGPGYTWGVWREARPS